MAPHIRIGFRRWRRSVFWVIIALVILEFPLTVAALTLFGIADPDTYRTRLWEDGHLNGFNSDPSAPLYAAANYQSIKIPIIWSGYMTKFNLIISVFSMFLLLAKVVLVPMHVLFPILSFFIHGLEVGLWSFSVYGQSSSDTIDPKFKQNGPPWYITKSCSVVFKPDNKQYCEQAKASFYVAIFMLLLFVVQLVIAIQGMIFAPEPGNTDDEMSISSIGKGHSTEETEREWEMVQIPPTP